MAESQKSQEIPQDYKSPMGSGLCEFTFPSHGSTVAISARAILPLANIEFLVSPRANLLKEIRDGALWRGGTVALSDILQRHENPAETRAIPYTESISAGKNTYTYDAHTYHTKVPPQGITHIINKYLPQGGLVFDPFSGSGMTGVAAQYAGCDVILNDLSPAAGFISYNFTRSVDSERFNGAVLAVAHRLGDLRRVLYSTTCRECGSETEILYTVWSYDVECSHCKQGFILWDHCRKYGRTVREHKLLRTFPCPHCGDTVNKSRLARGEIHPVLIGYKCCAKKQVEHPLIQADIDRIDEASRLAEKYRSLAPQNPLPDGVNLGQPKRHGLDTIARFYTSRNLIASAALWQEIRRIQNAELASAVAFVFTSLYQRITRLSEFRFWGGSGNTANFNVPYISNEANVFVTFLRKAKTIADHFVTTAANYKGTAVVHTGSATDLTFLPDNSVDLIFTDPPFGANINYSEMNILWESWLEEFTNPAQEVIVNRAQEKNVEDYQRLMTESLREAYRVLREGHWMVLVFMNSSEKVWRALRAAIINAGFTIEKTNIFDKQHGTFKQYVSDNTAGSDLMIHCRKHCHRHCRKTSPKRSSDINTIESEFESVADFMASLRDNIPIVSYLHVCRKSEIDYRTLYSSYISTALKDGRPIVDFVQFRREAGAALGDI